MCSACSTRHQAPGRLSRCCATVRLRAFDLARADRQSFGQGVAIVQLVGACAEIAMAGSHRRMLVIDFGGLAMSDERPQNGVETPAFERLPLRLDEGAAPPRVGRDGFRSRRQVFANVIEINQIAALVAELLLDLADDPGRAVAESVNPRVRPEAGANRAGGQLAAGFFDPALDRARINRRQLPCACASDSFASRHDNVLPLRLSFCSQLGSTIGTMPPSVSTMIGLLSPGASGNST